MPRTSSAREHNFVCPLCSERLASDDQGKGFVKHLTPPRGPAIFDDVERVNRMLRSGDLARDYMNYFEYTGLCPFQQAQRDEVIHPTRSQ